MANHHYSCRDGVLQIWDASDTLIWSGRVGEGIVARAIPLYDTGECAVLVEEADGRNPRNIVRVRSDGSVVWHAQPAPDFGPYVEMTIHDHHLRAWSWSGYLVDIDPDNGSILSAVFVK